MITTRRKINRSRRRGGIDMEKLTITLTAPSKVTWDKFMLKQYLYQQAKQAINNALDSEDCPFETETKSSE